jgi:hypothetical protein
MFSWKAEFRAKSNGSSINHSYKTWIVALVWYGEQLCKTIMPYAETGNIVELEKVRLWDYKIHQWFEKQSLGLTLHIGSVFRWFLNNKGLQKLCNCFEQDSYKKQEYFQIKKERETAVLLHYPEKRHWNFQPKFLDVEDLEHYDDKITGKITVLLPKKLWNGKLAFYLSNSTCRCKKFVSSEINRHMETFNRRDWSGRIWLQNFWFWITGWYVTSPKRSSELYFRTISLMHM